MSQTGRLGEILVQLGYAKEADIKRGLHLQRENGQYIGRCLIQLGIINEDRLLEALSRQFSMPIYDHRRGRSVSADPSLIKKAPRGYLKRNRVCPIRQQDGCLEVLVNDPLNYQALDDLGVLFNSPIRPILAGELIILEMINAGEESSTGSSEQIMDEIDGQALQDFISVLEEPEDLLDASEQAPIIKLVNTVLSQAVRQRASDIHIEPFERELLVRYRIDGILYDTLRIPRSLHPAISSRVKVMANLDIAEKRLPQDGRIKIKIAEKQVDIRVSVVPTAFGERLVLRLLDTSSIRLRLREIGLAEGDYTRFVKLIHKPNGIILSTGPTGSGKTTTLYAALQEINSHELNIITIEDPIEYRLENVGQIQVNPKINLTFAAGLRHILRQDPDVIMVGEIRDRETADMAVQASLTGHLVFSTLHTNDAAGAVTRLMEMDIEPFLISSSLLAVISQRLVRILCDHCKRERRLNDEQKAIFQGYKIEPPVTVCAPVGCDKCAGKGYLGRTGIFEILYSNDDIRELILQGADADTIKNKAVSLGMQILRADGLRKVIDKITSLEEVIRVTRE